MGLLVAEIPPSSGDEGVLGKINDKLRRKVCAAEGRDSEPSALIVDSQSVKTKKNAKERGFDAGKKKSSKSNVISPSTYWD